MVFENEWCKNFGIALLGARDEGVFVKIGHCWGHFISAMGFNGLARENHTGQYPHRRIVFLTNQGAARVPPVQR